MRIFVATEYRITKYENEYYVESDFYSILKRYKEAFGDVILCTRIKTETPKETDCKVTEYITKVVKCTLLEAFSYRCMDKMRREIRACDLVVGRFHSIIAVRAYKCAKSLGKPFMAELMGCAWDAYWNHSIKGKIIAPYMYYMTRGAVKGADYALYVTSEFLQKRYPCSNLTISASNVKIDAVNEEILSRRLDRIGESLKQEITLMTVAAVDVKYKGQEYVIKAIKKLNNKGFKIKYVMVGGGNPSRLQQIANDYGVSDQIQFTGKLKHEEVLQILENTDIYVQPSLQEGLPRAVIEAMSCACPCIGARTAGIPELLNEDCVFERKSEKAIYETVVRIWDIQTLQSLATGNLERSKDYLNSTLTERRNEFYNKIIKDIEGHEVS